MIIFDFFKFILIIKLCKIFKYILGIYMSTGTIKEVKLYNADTLEYAGSMVVKNDSWEYVNVEDKYLSDVTQGMPLKSVLPCLITFNLVYDVIEE